MQYKEDINSRYIQKLCSDTIANSTPFGQRNISDMVYKEKIFALKEMENIESLNLEELRRLKRYSHYLNNEQKVSLEHFYDRMYSKHTEEVYRETSKNINIKKNELTQKQELFNSLKEQLKSKCIEKYGSDNLQYDRYMRCLNGDKNNSKMLTNQIKNIKKILKKFYFEDIK